MLTQDFILNGVAHGEIAQMTDGLRFDPGLLRPYIDQHGRKCVTINTGRKRYNPKTGRDEAVYEKRTLKEIANMGIEMPIQNITTLRKDEWKILDRTLIRVARSRMRAWADLAAANPFGGFNGFNRTVLEYETINDFGEAIVDMDGLTEGRSDSPQYGLQGLPLPITHSDFWFSSRRQGISRNSDTRMDFTQAEMAARRIGEAIEKTTIGTQLGMTYGNSADYGAPSTVYGYTNFPDRMTYTSLTNPSLGTGNVSKDIVQDILQMRSQMYDNNYYGPFIIYYSTDWDVYLDEDYQIAGGNNPGQTLRQRIMAIDGISSLRRLDYLDSNTNPFSMLMIQMTSDVARAVIGMPLTTVQWDTKGGLQRNFKVMTIMVPQVRSDFNGRTGILHATTS